MSFFCIHTSFLAHKSTHTRMFSSSCPSKKRKAGAPSAPGKRPSKKPQPPQQLLDVSIPDAGVLSTAQQKVLHAVQRRENIFVTGRAGCGKSNVIRCLVKCMDAMGTHYAVTAPTGIAAEQIGGVTIHSLTALDERLDIAECIRRAKRYKQKELKGLQVLIIDEVSMLSAQTFDAVLSILRAYHPVNMPVLVLVGDFLQLPPVSGDVLLDTPTWRAQGLNTILLPDCFRQESPAFLKALDEARIGALSDTSVSFFRSRVDAVVDSDVEPTILMPLRHTVEDINRRRLSQLVGERVDFVGKVFVGTRDSDKGEWVPEKDISPEFPAGLEVLPVSLRGLTVMLPCEKSAWMDAAAHVSASASFSPLLTLAEGAQVVFTANISPQVVNGTRGVMTGFTADRKPIVKLFNGTEIAVPIWQRSKRVDKEHEMPCLVFEQIPLQLAWALTIHKSQGMSLDAAKLDLGKAVFSHGQGYVALSRLRTPEGMILMNFNPEGVTANQDIVKWYKEMEAKVAAETALATAAGTETTATVASKYFQPRV